MSFFKKKKVVPLLSNPIDEWLIFGPGKPSVNVHFRTIVENGKQVHIYWQSIGGEREVLKIGADEYATEEGKQIVVEAWEAWLKTCADAARKAVE